MRIGLLYNDILPPVHYGGIERIVTTLADEYVRQGHEVVLVCREGSSGAGHPVVPLVAGEDPLERLPSGLDFLHSHQPLQRPPDLPYLVTIHGNGHRGERYLPNTNFLSKSHARNHGSSTFVYNGLDPSRYPFISEKSDHLVFLARASWPVKNATTAIDLARDTGRELHVLGGDGHDEKFVKYYGMVDEPEKLPVLSTAAALIYPTNWDEPCAVAPLEAMACGTPVISSTNGCMPELVDASTGVICSDYGQLLGAVQRLGQFDPAACRRRVEELFSQSRMAREYLAHMRRISDGVPLSADQPRYSFRKKSVRLIYKPTLRNRIKVALGRLP